MSDTSVLCPADVREACERGVTTIILGGLWASKSPACGHEYYGRSARSSFLKLFNHYEAEVWDTPHDQRTCLACQDLYVASEVDGLCPRCSDRVAEGTLNPADVYGED